MHLAHTGNAGAGQHPGRSVATSGGPALTVSETTEADMSRLTGFGTGPRKSPTTEEILAAVEHARDMSCQMRDGLDMTDTDGKVMVRLLYVGMEPKVFVRNQQWLEQIRSFASDNGFAWSTSVQISPEMCDFPPGMAMDILRGNRAILPHTAIDSDLLRG